MLIPYNTFCFHSYFTQTSSPLLPQGEEGKKKRFYDLNLHFLSPLSLWERGLGGEVIRFFLIAVSPSGT